MLDLCDLTGLITFQFESDCLPPMVFTLAHKVKLVRSSAFGRTPHHIEKRPARAELSVLTTCSSDQYSTYLPYTTAQHARVGTRLKYKNLVL